MDKLSSTQDIDHGSIINNKNLSESCINQNQDVIRSTLAKSSQYSSKINIDNSSKQSIIGEEKDIMICAFYFYNNEKTKRNIELRSKPIQTSNNNDSINRVLVQYNEIVFNNPYQVDNCHFYIFHQQNEQYAELFQDIVVDIHVPLKILVKSPLIKNNQQSHQMQPNLKNQPMSPYPMMDYRSATNSILSSHFMNQQPLEQQFLPHSVEEYMMANNFNNNKNFVHHQHNFNKPHSIQHRADMQQYPAHCSSNNAIYQIHESQQQHYNNNGQELCANMMQQVHHNANNLLHNWQKSDNASNNLNGECRQISKKNLPSSTINSSLHLSSSNTDFFENLSNSSKSTHGPNSGLQYINYDSSKTSQYNPNNQNRHLLQKNVSRNNFPSKNLPNNGNIVWCEHDDVSNNISVVSSSTETTLKIGPSDHECTINEIDITIDMSKIKKPQLTTAFIEGNHFIIRMGSEFIKAGIRQLDCFLKIDDFNFHQTTDLEECKDKIDSFLREKSIFKITIGRLSSCKELEDIIKMLDQPTMDSISTAPTFHTNDLSNQNCHENTNANNYNDNVIKSVARSSSSSKETDSISIFSDNNVASSTTASHGHKEKPSSSSVYESNVPSVPTSDQVDLDSFTAFHNDIRHNITLDTSLIDIVKFMKHPESKFELTTRVFCSMRFHNSFTGHQLIDWLLTYVKGLYEHKDAIVFGQRLLTNRLIYCPLQTRSTKNRHAIFNENSFYIFTHHIDFTNLSFGRLDEIPEENSSGAAILSLNDSKPLNKEQQHQQAKALRSSSQSLDVATSIPSGSTATLSTKKSKKLNEPNMQRNNTIRRSGKFSTIV